MKNNNGTETQDETTAIKPRKFPPELEITPAMIEAGLDELIEGTSCFPLQEQSEGERAALVGKIYSAMARKLPLKNLGG